MATPISKLGAFTGTIDGITYYTLNGKRVCRKASPPSKEQINMDPRFDAVKKNNNEFGGASTYAKAIKSGLGDYLDIFKDSTFHSRLTGCCQKIIKAGEGKPGQRTINIMNNPEALVGLQLNAKNSFNEKLRFTPEIVKKRSGVNLSLSGLKKHHLYGIPTSATHFVLITIRNGVPGYNYNEIKGKYEPTPPIPMVTKAAAGTPPIPIANIPEPLEFVLPFAKREDIQKVESKTAPKFGLERIAHTIWIGMLYGEIINNKFVPFETSKTMECVAVY